MSNVQRAEKLKRSQGAQKIASEPLLRPKFLCCLIRTSPNNNFGQRRSRFCCPLSVHTDARWYKTLLSQAFSILKDLIHFTLGKLLIFSHKAQFHVLRTCACRVGTSSKELPLSCRSASFGPASGFAHRHHRAAQWQKPGLAAFRDLRHKALHRPWTTVHTRSPG